MNRFRMRIKRRQGNVEFIHQN